MGTRVLALLVIAACASIVGAGCDAGDALDELNPIETMDTREIQIENTMEAWVDAINDEDWETACEQLTSGAIRDMLDGADPSGTRFTESDLCQLRLAMIFEGTDDLGGPAAEIDSVEEQGNNLRVTLTDDTVVLVEGKPPYRLASLQDQGG